MKQQQIDNNSNNKSYYKIINNNNNYNNYYFYNYTGKNTLTWRRVKQRNRITVRKKSIFCDLQQNNEFNEPLRKVFFHEFFIFEP